MARPIRIDRLAPLLVALLAVTSVLLAAAAAPAPAQATSDPVTLTNYTDPAQALAWGQKSHWKQPWRSYLDTVPASTLLNAIGINFNVNTNQAEATATLLGHSGFRRARIEVPWGTIDYDNPTQMTEASRENLRTAIGAMRDNGIRPLILLNANHSHPCPTVDGTIRLLAPAHAGDTAIHVNPFELWKISPGRTGISSGGVAAQYLFTSFSLDGTVQLSAPLGSLTPAVASAAAVTELPAGPLEVETLRYEPFHAATSQDGVANPAFEPTMEGWLDYVHAVTNEVKSILGSEEFDVEVWNELSFGSRFLNVNNYYSPPLEASEGASTEQILERTIDLLRDPANGVPNIGIGDGFASQTPWPSAADLPVGLTAVDKHPYPKYRSFPADAALGGNRPLNGLGQVDGRKVGSMWEEIFTPTYEAWFPEYTLSGIQTETLVHDIAPQPSLVGRVEHGRYVHAPGGSPAAEWITEVNLNPGTGPTAEPMSQADIRHVATKDTLRFILAFVNKGVTAIDMYAAQGGNFSLIESSFFHALKGKNPAYPGDEAGGETMAAVHRLVESMSGAEPIANPRQLSLQALTDYSGNVQFAGGTGANYPPLYNREVFAFLPFQVSARRFVVPVYVMTRNVVHDYEPGSTEPSRFDLPAEPYAMEIGGVDGENVSVSATDPSNGASVPVQVLERSDHDVTVKMPVTDSPRLLTLEEDEAGSPPAEGPVTEAGETPPAPVGGEEGKAAKPKAATKEKSASGPKLAGQAEAAGEPAGGLLLQVRGRRSLLRQRHVELLARCRSRCRLSVHSKLLVGPRHYQLRIRSRRPLVSGGDAGTASAPLILDGGDARVGRQAARSGASVKLEVVVRWHSGGQARTKRRVFPVPSQG